MPIEEENIKGLFSKWGLTAKPCDSCHSSAALLFCRAHSAFLCTACDSKIHAAATTAARHERVWMCEVCEQSPAAVTCKADAAALCSSCDRDIHSANPLARRHERVPVVPFFQTPPDLSAAAKTTSPPSDFFLSDEGVQPPHADVVYAASVDDDSWLIPNLHGKLAGPDFLYSSDVDSLLDSGSPNFSIKHQVNNQMFNQRGYSAFAGADSVVPSQPKSSHLNNFSNDSCFEIDFTLTQSKLSPFNFSSQCISQSISSSDVGIVPDGNSNSMSEVSDFQFSKPASINGGGDLDGGSTAQPVQLSRMDRAARVLRYREKRKNRKFEKTIRYASRKAYAEARPRIKGRFVKRTNADAELDQIYRSSVSGAAGGFLVDDELYGVVPSF